MRVERLQAPRAGRTWTALLVASAALHAMLLGAFALRLPSDSPAAEPGRADLTFIPAPRLAPPRGLAAPRSPANAPSRRLVALDVPPRYAGPPVVADTGEASDAVDLFGPVFVDGMWPRPVVVRREPCDPDDPTAAGVPCRRELLLIGPVGLE